ncbi:MAG: hypothetical protein ACM3O8_12355, partial [Methylococcaceae bacterium]
MDLSVGQNFQRLLLLVAGILVSVSTFSQTHLEGRVLDAETDLPVSSFKLIIQTDQYSFDNGSFDIDLPSNASPQNTLTFIAEGYMPLTISIGNDSSKAITIALIPQNINIQEIVVKAFNSDKRQMDTPGAIAIITNRQIVREPSFTLAPSVNKTPGVWMQSGTM